MDFKQIEAFVNVARYKSFSKAADAMFFTQPTISAHVAALENELGQKLFRRRGREITLTPAGEKFYPRALEMVNLRANAIREMAVPDQQTPIIRIMSSSIPSIVFLPEVLSEFRDIHPDVLYMVDSSDTQTVLDDIAQQRGDIGFVGDYKERADLVFHEIFSDHMLMVAPVSYDLPDEISMEEALQHPFIWREYGSATRETFEKTVEEQGFGKKDFKVVANFNDLDPLIRAVEQGLGVSLLSELTVERLEAGKVKTVRIRGFDFERRFYMVTSKSAVLTSVAEDFISYVLSRSDTGKDR